MIMKLINNAYLPRKKLTTESTTEDTLIIQPMQSYPGGTFVFLLA